MSVLFLDCLSATFVVQTEKCNNEFRRPVDAEVLTAHCSVIGLSVYA